MAKTAESRRVKKFLRAGRRVGALMKKQRATTQWVISPLIPKNVLLKFPSINSPPEIPLRIFGDDQATPESFRATLFGSAEGTDILVPDTPLPSLLTGIVRREGLLRPATGSDPPAPSGSLESDFALCEQLENEDRETSLRGAGFPGQNDVRRLNSGSSPAPPSDSLEGTISPIARTPLSSLSTDEVRRRKLFSPSTEFDIHTPFNRTSIDPDVSFNERLFQKYENIADEMITFSPVDSGSYGEPLSASASTPLFFARHGDSGNIGAMEFVPGTPEDRAGLAGRRSYAF